VDQDCIASLQAGLNQEDAIELDENEIVGFSLQVNPQKITIYDSFENKYKLNAKIDTAIKPSIVRLYFI